MDVNSDTLEIQKKHFIEQNDLLYKNLFISVPSSFLCATIIYFALHRIPHTSILNYWFIAVIITTLLRLVHAFRYLKDKQHSKTRFYIFLAMTTISAALWGVAGSFLMPAGHQVEQMIVIVILSGIASGGIQSLESSLSASFIFINLLIVPLACWIFLHNQTSYTILGVSVLVYLVFNLGISVRGNKFLKHTLRLKHRNIDLAENLSVKNKQLVFVNQEIQEKENNLRLIHDNAPIGMAIVSIDGKWLNVNNKLCDIVGYSKEELENLTIQDVTYQEDLESDLDNRTKLLSGKLQSYQIEKRYINKNHQLIWIVTNVSLVRGKKNEPLYYISQIQDINDRKQNETLISLLSKMNAMLQLCRNSTEAYSIITQNASELFADMSGGLAIFNKNTHQLEIKGTWGSNSVIKLSFKSEECWAFRAGNIYIANDIKKDAYCHHFSNHSLGAYICIPLIVQSQVLGMLNFSTSLGQTISSYQQEVINNFSEIIKLSLSNIQLKEVLHDQAIHDPLTGLFNRRYLYEILPQMLQQALQTEHSFCVCMMDIDFFKHINDQFGHDAGDEVLKYMGSLLKKRFRENDVAFRYGGEEFIVLLQDTDLQHANKKIEQIRLELSSNRMKVKNYDLPVITMSVGIAEAPKHGISLNKLLQSADAALYTAKETGRNKIVNFDENLI